MVIFPIEELKRKSFHLLTLIYIYAYWFMPKTIVLWSMGVIIFFVALLEGARLRSPAFNKKLMKIMSGAYRESETNTVSGLPWTLSGSFFTMLLFPDKSIVLASMFYLAFGDASAALVGKRMGKRKIFWEKTLEGSFACFAVCFLIGMFFFNWKLSIAGALAAAVIELFPWALNDNFWMPIISAFALSQLMPLLR